MAGTRPRYHVVSSCDRIAALGLSMDLVWTYRVDLQIPRLSRRVQINNHLIILQSQFLQHDVRPMRPWTPVICVKSDLWRVSVDVSHDVDRK